MNGVFVAVVGPSGVGKDSVMAYARERAGQDTVFVRRTVTRPPNAGGEDYEAMTVEAFKQAEAEGRFALSWEAHGLHYGLPLSLEDDLHEGRVVVANLSRRVLPAMAARYPNAVVVSLTAERDVIARRLAARGRETEESIQRRLDRQVPDTFVTANTVTIDNSGALEVAGDRLVVLLKTLSKLHQPA